MEMYLDKLIHMDQSGFMKGLLAADNIRRLMHVIHETQQPDTPCAVLSIDDEKAFDRLEWQYLFWRNLVRERILSIWFVCYMLTLLLWFLLMAYTQAIPYFTGM
jgi:hypothetical protein